MIRSIASVLSVLAALGLLAACGGAEKAPQTGFLSDYSNLEKVDDNRLEYRNPNVTKGTYKAFIVDSTAALSNVAVHDFQGLTSTTHDLDRYKDLEHYDIAANREIIAAIRSASAQVDAANYDDVLAEQRRQIDRYLRMVCRGDLDRRFLCPRVAARNR